MYEFPQEGSLGDWWYTPFLIDTNKLAKVFENRPSKIC